MTNWERQAQYDRLLAHFAGTTDLPMEFRQSRACALLHDRIVDIIEGREPWPARLAHQENPGQ